MMMSFCQDIVVIVRTAAIVHIGQVALLILHIHLIIHPLPQQHVLQVVQGRLLHQVAVRPPVFLPGFILHPHLLQPILWAIVYYPKVYLVQM